MDVYRGKRDDGQGPNRARRPTYAAAVTSRDVHHVGHSSNINSTSTNILLLFDEISHTTCTSINTTWFSQTPHLKAISRTDRALSTSIVTLRTILKAWVGGVPLSPTEGPFNSVKGQRRSDVVDKYIRSVEYYSVPAPDCTLNKSLSFIRVTFNIFVYILVQCIYTWI